MRPPEQGRGLVADGEPVPALDGVAGHRFCPRGDAA